MDQGLLQRQIQNWLMEDVGSGDYSTLASIPAEAAGKAALKIKEAGILAGMEVAETIFKLLEPEAEFLFLKKDGEKMAIGEVAFEVNAKVHTILKAERLLLNCMQRMSGIATLTGWYVEKIGNYPTKLLDTRKTTPGLRMLEKEAVRIGGGVNHRMGLFDMIMLKDNHIDYCGGITKAVQRVRQYLRKHQLDLPIEVEARKLEDVREILTVGGVDRIMLDNFTPEKLREALEVINHQVETEASGGIDLENIAAYAATGVDYISAGAVIHHAVSLDLSLKAVIL